jgi:hypothetical protein
VFLVVSVEGDREEELQIRLRVENQLGPDVSFSFVLCEPLNLLLNLQN